MSRVEKQIYSGGDGKQQHLAHSSLTGATPHAIAQAKLIYIWPQCHVYLYSFMRLATKRWANEERAEFIAKQKNIY